MGVQDRRYTENVSKIPKWDCILNCCYYFPRTNDPYLKSSEQLDSFFSSSLHKIKFHIFQNISKCLIHVLRLFKYKNRCELYNNILDKYKKGRIMVKKCFVLHEEVIYVFYDKNCIPTI